MTIRFDLLGTTDDLEKFFNKCTSKQMFIRLKLENCELVGVLKSSDMLDLKNNNVIIIDLDTKTNEKIYKIIDSKSINVSISFTNKTQKHIFFNYVKTFKENDIDKLRIVIWVEDRFENNAKFVEIFEGQGIFYLRYFTTEDVIEAIQKYTWISNLETNLKIITNMSRKEKDIPKGIAGIDFIKTMLNKFQYKDQIMVFVSEQNRLLRSKQLKESGLTYNNYFLGTIFEDLVYFVKDLLD